jgi:hypothetical protein
MVRIELTQAEAEALTDYALEGQLDSDARGEMGDGGEHPATRAAGGRAVAKLVRATSVGRVRS